MPTDFSDILGRPVLRTTHAGSGAAGSVLRLHLADGTTLIAKSATRALDTEAAMLSLLAQRSNLPLPAVVHAEPTLLIMTDCPGAPSFSPAAEEHAAELLADLHSRPSPDARFGLHFDGCIGPLPQPNTPSTSWPDFWRDRRILPMIAAAENSGHLPAPLARRAHLLARRLPDLLPQSPHPSLIHGDVWSGNVLSAGDRITAFLDPAPYYAHAEVELAFITLFSTFGEPFFARYHRLRPIDPDFHRSRIHIYLLYPLLIHTTLFGSSYLPPLTSAIENALS